mmetsp:Transcript_85243/g.246081  ORF Transcript_85243/g.246081 Transcript_85243/m.246081 type:complete len:340 (-) Transcript_85243:758-1777(-)
MGAGACPKRARSRGSPRASSPRARCLLDGLRCRGPPCCAPLQPSLELRLHSAAPGAAAAATATAHRPGAQVADEKKHHDGLPDRQVARLGRRLVLQPAARSGLDDLHRPREARMPLVQLPHLARTSLVTLRRELAHRADHDLRRDPVLVEAQGHAELLVHRGHGRAVRHDRHDEEGRARHERLAHGIRPAVAQEDLHSRVLEHDLLRRPRRHEDVRRSVEVGRHLLECPQHRDVPRAERLHKQLQPPVVHGHLAAKGGVDNLGAAGELGVEPSRDLFLLRALPQRDPGQGWVVVHARHDHVGCGHQVMASEQLRQGRHHQGVGPHRVEGIALERRQPQA